MSTTKLVYHTKLSTGKHDIGYSFIVPSNVPSSLDVHFGIIRYKVKAKAGSEKNEFVLNIISPPSIQPNELLVSFVKKKFIKLHNLIFFIDSNNGKQKQKCWLIEWKDSIDAL